MLPIESECVQRAIFWGVRGMRDQGRELTGRSSWPGLLGLDQAVADGLGGGQRAASARVVPDLVALTTGHLGQPESRSFRFPLGFPDWSVPIHGDECRVGPG